jgi:thiosulfate/3-mercaptopyruvate sulfurtransferase
MKGQPKINIAAAFTTIVCILGLGAVLSLQQAAQLRTTAETGSRFVTTSASQMNAEFDRRWIIDAVTAKQLLDSGATLLDARGEIQPGQHLRGAVAVTWQQFSQEKPPNQGNLLTNDQALTETLQRLGISEDQPVVVVADPETGWGEEGRIVWMLRSLGHQQAVMVDGGYRALHRAGVPKQLVASPTGQPGNFVVNRSRDWEIQRDELKAHLAQPRVVVIDSRGQDEYEGETPYGETRGGHIPGAIHLHYREFLDEDGKLRSREEIVQILQTAGVSRSDQIITYCTAGIRSAWLTVVLSDLGFNAKNYAGSMWEWSAAPVDRYPLVNSQTRRN